MRVSGSVQVHTAVTMGLSIS